MLRRILLARRTHANSFSKSAARPRFFKRGWAHFAPRLALSLFLSFNVMPVFAAPGNSAATSANASEKASAEEMAPAPSDPLGRSTPRGTFEGYLNAVSNEDYERAAQYLDLAPLPFDQRIHGDQVARMLQRALDRNSDIPPMVMLSNEARGEVDDDLSPELERIGSLKIDGREVDLLLQYLESGDQGKWLISAESLSALPNDDSNNATLGLNELIPGALLETKWNGVPVGHWIAIVLLAALSFGIIRATIGSVGSATRMVLRRRLHHYPEGLVKAFSTPAQLFAAVWIFALAIQKAGISIIARQTISEVLVIVAWLSVLWLVWRLIDVVAAVFERRMTSRSRFGALSAVLLLRRSSRVLLVVVGAIVALHTAGVDVTTGLAALGIGGIAVALGAQKMMENLVGSMTLVFDQPVRIGDFCKVGDTLGTVEQIGMRSTRIRTLDRTLITIPNGEFSAQKIENYAHRDRFWFHPVLAVRYQSSPAQIRWLLAELRNVLRSHPQVDPDPARVRFLGFGDSALKIEIFAYVLANDYDGFLEVQEELNLLIAEAVEKSGTGFALPSQTVYLSREPGPGPAPGAHPAGHVDEGAAFKDWESIARSTPGTVG
ncbi:mechanosensitive ion channel family protein [Gilvimarinus sp. F26214L]|uniref:mechanosensitive ion channel family protein n=1 Tax=Gilvimarinus sp. DZF01 TaxID=3461371 RepID=UPI0040468766